MKIQPNPWKKEPIHRIMTFCEHGMTKDVVKDFLTEFKTEGCRILLDPFVGSGTVLVEGLKVADICIGIDSNPWSLIVSKAKLQKPKFDLDEVNAMLEDIMEYEPFIPTSRLGRYYDNGTLEILGKLRAIVEKVNDPLMLVVFAKVAEKYSNLKRSPAPKFRKARINTNLDNIVREFRRELEVAMNDLKTNGKGIFSLILSDSSVWLPKKFDGILTSPPYANNIDYIRHTQLPLLWSGLAKDSRDLGRLRSFQIPACEAAARSWKPKIEDIEVTSLISKVNSKRRYNTFLLQYFYAMSKHFELVADGLQWQAWYTIGDSYFAGTYIPTHELLRKLAEKSGLEVKVELIGHRSAKNRRLFLLKVKP